MRVLIIGAPKCEKTTLALKLATENPEAVVTHIDSLVTKLEWSQLSDHIAEMLERPGDWIIEGCSGVRGLRKFLKKGLVPEFEIKWLDTPRVEQTGKQRAFGASCASIYKECLQMLKGKG